MRVSVCVYVFAQPTQLTSYTYYILTQGIQPRQALMVFYVLYPTQLI